MDKELRFVGIMDVQSMEIPELLKNVFFSMNARKDTE